MQGFLENRTAIITGGNVGIGKAIATRFVEEGANIALFDINEESGGATVAELQALNAKARIAFFQVDVSSKESVVKGVGDALEAFEKIDILVNNAGITRDNLILRMKEEDWDAVLNVNLKSVFNTCQALTRSMLKNKRGKIINIASVVGLTGNPGQVNYSASKAGMLGFTKSLAKELASRNICVNCIAPGYIRTRMTDKLNDKQKEDIMATIPLKRMGSTKDIANAAVFLASEMADYITGQVITVDGGMVM